MNDQMLKEAPAMTRTTLEPDGVTRHYLTATQTEKGGFTVDGVWNRELPIPRYRQRVLIEGGERAGYGIGAVPEWASARQTHGGPLVRGPWGYGFKQSTVIARDPNEGTAADMRREDAARMLVRAKPGDVLVLGGNEYEIGLDARLYPTLTLVENIDPPVEPEPGDSPLGPCGCYDYHMADCPILPATILTARFEAGYADDDGGDPYAR